MAAKVNPIFLGLCLIIAVSIAGALALTSHPVPEFLQNLIYILVGGTTTAAITPATQQLIAAKTTPET